MSLENFLDVALPCLRYRICSPKIACSNTEKIKVSKEVSMFELTVPSETRIEISNKLKLDKYKHFTTDIQNHKVTVTPFEIGSSQGYISRENKTALHSLHKFCQSDIKLKKFKENISAITILASYYIFNCRNLEAWDCTDTINPPFSNN